MLLILVILPFACLTLFLGLSIKSFIEDKVAFVFEADELNSKKLAAELTLLLEKVRNLTDDHVFVATADSDFQNFSISGEIQNKQEIQNWLSQYSSSVCSKRRNISWMTLGSQLMYIHCHRGPEGFTIYRIHRDKLSNLFAARGVSDSALIGLDGFVISGSSVFPVGKEISSVVGNEIKKAFDSSDVDQGHFEITNHQDKNKYLVNFYRVPNEPLVILSFTPRTAPQRAALFFVYKGVISAVALIFIAILASFIISSALLKNILELRGAMALFGEGHLDVHLQPKSKDEIGQLATMFNKMVEQIKVLLRSQEEKAKVDAEMSLAAELQQKFFPPAHFEKEGFQFAGYYEPAGKCGGDWWSYIDNEDYLIVFIGDVTGHGMHSALITSAARAVLAGFKKEFKSPADSMSALNHAVYDTSAGALNMTCIIAAFDKKSSRLIYSNASHEMPYYFKADANIKRSHLNVLSDVHGPRLGEKAAHIYSQSEVSFDPGTMFFFYSDGLTDLVNSEGKNFGERNVLKAFLKFKSQKFSAIHGLKEMTESVKTWSEETALVDDLSYFYLKAKD